MTNARVLVVEDDQDAVKEITMSLKRLGNIVSAVVDTGEEAIKRAESDPLDLVLMDIKLKGGMDGIEAASQITSRFKTPVIYLSANADHLTIKRAKKANANGFLMKPFREEELGATIEMVVHKHKNEKDEYSVIWDSLTGAYSKAFLMEILNRDVAICKRYHRPLSVMMVHIDTLPQINDKYGYRIGCDAIRYVTKAIRSRIRSADCLARFKGDTFCCILSETALAPALICAEKVRSSIAQRGFVTRDGMAKLTCSIGVIGSDKINNSSQWLLLEAEKTLDLAKRGGGNRVEPTRS